MKVLKERSEFAGRTGGWPDLQGTGRDRISGTSVHIASLEYQGPELVTRHMGQFLVLFTFVLRLVYLADIMTTGLIILSFGT